VTSDRLAEILAELSSGPEVTWSSVRLCELAREVAGVDGAGAMLMSGDLPLGILGTTDEVSNQLERLQFSLGEGPCVDAFQYSRVVLEPRLAAPEVNRWPAFTTAALATGARALFGFPLTVGAARLGALNLYRLAPGRLSDDQHSDALAMSHVMADWVLHMQSTAAAGQLARALARDLDVHAVVHQAAGAVSVQLEVSLTEALIRLRAYAFAHDRPLHEVGADIVARRLRLSR
jgi:hypothetical protein